MRLILQFCLVSLAIAGDSQCSRTVCQVADKSLRFFAFGDWGGFPTWPYYGQINGKSWRLPENSFPTGTWRQLLRTWRVRCRLKQISKNVRGNVSAEIAYSQKSSRWMYPNYYYPIKYQLVGGPKIHFVVLDTILLCGNTRHTSLFNWLEKPTQPEGPKSVKTAAEQWLWLEDQLKTSDADYLFVLGHFPVYSIAEHGPTACLVERLEPMLTKYKVSAYLSGHDHNLQHFAHNSGDWELNYILSGAGAYSAVSSSHAGDVPAGSSRFFYPPDTGIVDETAGLTGVGRGGLVYAEVDQTAAKFTFFTSEGEIVHTVAIGPRQ